MVRVMKTYLQTKEVVKYHVDKARDLHREAMKVRKRKGNVMVYDIIMEGRAFHMAAAHTADLLGQGK